MTQPALFAATPPAPTGTKHVCFPDFSLACGIGFLEQVLGDNVHYGTPERWADVTCDWCRALGRHCCRVRIDRMQAVAA